MDVVDMVTALGDIFRGSITHDLEPMLVTENLALIEKYLYIQKIRYGERFRFRIDLDDAVADVHIPQFIIQPLVENAIGHGMSTLETGGRIHLTLQEKGKRIRIEVRDNGRGMDAETLEKIRRGLRSQGPSIGLSNVHDRLRLRYGTDFTFTLDSTPAGGTTVILEFPAERPT